MGDLISCSFSLFNEGRTYTGHHRKYVIENARAICDSPATRERIQLREALGFYGHGRRVLAGKMNIEEVEAITLDDGSQAIISNVPSNVSTKFSVNPDGTVTHTQEILGTETGRIVTGLHSSKVGGFSWACSGGASGPLNTTKLTGFSGFDYVLSPGFAHNRGYVLESSYNTTQAILESVSAIVGDEKRAEQYVAGWCMAEKKGRIQILEDALFEADEREAEARFKIQQHEDALSQAVLERQIAILESAKIRDGWRDVLGTLATACPFFIPEQVMHEMLEGDFDRAKMVFVFSFRPEVQWINREQKRF